MSAPNGRANGSATNAESDHPVNPLVPLAATNPSICQQSSPEQIKELTAALEVPFDPRVVEWRVTNTSKTGKPRGQVIPYADQRAYTDRLNAVVSAAGWTRKYTLNTSANFQRGKDQRTVAKVFVTCELTIFGLGSHSATGEEWADDDNAGTSAEAQAFKRACSCFGLGRYLYYFSGEWVDVDDRRRPKSMPKLPKWATPEGWQQGLRVQQNSGANQSNPAATSNHAGRNSGGETGLGDTAALVCEIEALEESLGKGIYRGLLKTVARAWKANQIRDVALLQKVLTHMQAAERGLRRLDAALQVTGPEGIDPPLRSLKLLSLDRVDNLDTLKRIVLAVEEAAAKARR